MENSKKLSRNLNPRKGANIFSILTFAYTLPTFYKGLGKDLSEEDMTERLETHDSKKLGDQLEAAWKKEAKLSKDPSLWRAIARVFGWKFMSLGLVLLFLELVVKMAQPIALSQLIKFYTVTDEEFSINEAYIYAAVIVGAAFLNVMISHLYMLTLQEFGMQLRIACCSVIYRKSLRLNKSVLGGTTVGQMVNLLSNDVNRCDRSVHHAHQLWIVPIETVVIVLLLYGFVGLPSTVGVLFLVLFIPFQMYLGKKTSIYRLETALKTDERVRLMNEIVSGIQVIKMYTWEKPFGKLVALVRKLEVNHIRGVCYIRGLLLSLTIFTSNFAIFLTVLTYVLLGNRLTAEYVFVVTSFYNILKQTMTKQFPRGIAEVAEINVSISRLQKFLLYSEVGNEQTRSKNSYWQLNDSQNKNGIFRFQNESENNNVNVKVQLRNASAKWCVNSSKNTLHDINFQAETNQLVAIIGPVGCGKTSLLHLILKELPLQGGTMKVNGKISYASQEPWVFAGTVRENILFGQAMIKDRYYKVLQMCALEKDLLLLPHGDETIVGERGIALSGGQRARVNLARAIYKEADIYLLDDPLSAVDARVGKQLYEGCISGFLKNKCTILVTHQLQYLRNVNNIVVMENGKITARGSYEEVRKSKIEFAKQLQRSKNEVLDTLKEKQVYETREPKKFEEQTTLKEQRSTGNISGYVYMSYLQAGGSLLTCLGILLLFIITQVSVSGTDYFLTYWVNMEQIKLEQNKTLSQEIPRETCLYIYSCLTVSTLILSLYRSFTFFKYSMQASTRLHYNMFSNIVYAPMRFFNTNSTGRILNRFSKDMGSVDEVLPVAVIECLQYGLSILGVIAMVSVVNPWLLTLTAAMIVIFYFLRVMYMKTSRNGKRLEGIISWDAETNLPQHPLRFRPSLKPLFSKLAEKLVKDVAANISQNIAFISTSSMCNLVILARSPVFAHVSTSLQGLTTIRAFQAEKMLQKEFDDYQDLHSSVWYLFISCSRAFGFWIDLICVFYIALVTFSFLLFDNEQYSGNVGLAVTQAMSLTGMLQWSLRQWTELENQMTSVERVVEYTKIQQQPDPNKETTLPNWPEEGNIQFLSVSLRYSTTEPQVLKQLNFSIKSKEKIGIVGRTGSGKSSLIYALFQLTSTEGEILIDNINIATIPLARLRSKISIIPQEPILFSGTLRKNLDPFSEFSDMDLWTALEEVELKHVVADLPLGLNDVVSEGGANFSVGQRQLVCLARAIIRKNKILVLDEATANVDPQTDVFIQRTIRRKFADCTVLTIAHRLHTIMDSDKVLVMDAGQMVEFDHPHTLLQNKEGFFYGLVQQTGPGMAKILSDTANNTFRQCRR